MNISCADILKQLNEIISKIENNEKDTKRKLYIYNLMSQVLLNKYEKELRVLGKKRVSQVFLLGESDNPEIIPKLIEYTKSTNGNERRLAASALSKLSKYKPQIYDACPYLIRLLKDEKPQVRLYASKALGKIRFKGATPHLQQLLQDEKYYVRASARRSISRSEERRVGKECSC